MQLDTFTRNPVPLLIAVQNILSLPVHHAHLLCLQCLEKVLCNLPYSNTTNIQYLCFQNFRQLQKDHNMEVGDDSVPMLTNQYNVCHVNWYSNQKIHECQTISCSSDQDVVWVDEGPQLNLSLT